MKDQTLVAKRPSLGQQITLLALLAAAGIGATSKIAESFNRDRVNAHSIISASKPFSSLELINPNVVSISANSAAPRPTADCASLPQAFTPEFQPNSVKTAQVRTTRLSHKTTEQLRVDGGLPFSQEQHWVL